MKNPNSDSFPTLPESWKKLAILAENTAHPIQPVAHVMLDTGMVLRANPGGVGWMPNHLSHPWRDYLDVWGKNGIINKELRLPEG